MVMDILTDFGRWVKLWQNSKEQNAILRLGKFASSEPQKAVIFVGAQNGPGSISFKMN